MAIKSPNSENLRISADSAENLGWRNSSQPVHILLQLKAKNFEILGQVTGASDSATNFPVNRHKSPENKETLWPNRINLDTVTPRPTRK